MASSPVADMQVAEARSLCTVPAGRRHSRLPVSSGSCPHCKSDQVLKNGTFPLKDGSRQQRFRCHSCGKSVSPNTGTPMAYVKRPSERQQFQQTMGSGSSLRKQAAELGVHPSTTFRWRHKCLSTVAQQPTPQLSGQVAIGETYVAFSRKGQRSKPRGYRRFVDGRPSCVVFFVSKSGYRSAVVGSGALAAKALEPHLEQALTPEAQLCAVGARATAACRGMGLATADEADKAEGRRPLMQVLARASAGLHSWLCQFRGVATRYLHHYLAWYDSLVRACGQTLQQPSATRSWQEGASADPWPGDPLDPSETANVVTYFTS